MSGISTDPIAVWQRVAGKWQIPALILSVLLLATAVAHVKSPQRKISVAQHIETIEKLIHGGMYVPAIDRTEMLLGWKDVSPADRARLRLLRARAESGEMARIDDRSKAAAGSIIDFYDKAQSEGALLTAPDHARIAASYEALGQYRVAVRQYELAQKAAEPPALSYRRRVIELSEYPLREPPETIDGLVESYIADAKDDPRELIWALAKRVETVATEDGWSAAADFLAQYEDQFESGPLAEEYSYLTALALWGSERYDLAERELRELLNGVAVSDPVYSRAGWLLGKVVMYDGRAQRPEEALAIFRDVIASRVDPVYIVASRIGMGEALTYLQRYDESLGAYKQAIDDLQSVRPNEHANPEVIRTSLTVAADRCRHEDLTDTALEYMRLATSLVADENVDLLTQYLQRLGDLQAAVARECVKKADALEKEDETQRSELLVRARSLFDEAGETLARIARINTLNESLSADAMWAAAGLFDEGGDYERTIEVLQAFVRDRPDADVIPRLLLRLGQSLQALGRYEEAIDAYQRNYARYPRSPQANASLIPLAECYMALGGDSENLAERALLEVVQDSEIFTPEAPEYRDAMFLLGDLHHRRGEYEKAIPILDEALEKYSDDRRVPKAMFLAADAYRQSAMAIKDELLQPEFVGERKRMRAERINRLHEAADRFLALVKLLESRDKATLSEANRMYLQDARLYEAACLFELDQYTEALALYERAAWIYKDSPVALGAYVQVINCLVFLGREDDARAALRRAQYLVDRMPAEAFTSGGRFDSRANWKRYFDWVGEILVEQ